MAALGGDPTAPRRNAPRCSGRDHPPPRPPSRLRRPPPPRGSSPAAPWHHRRNQGLRIHLAAPGQQQRRGPDRGCHVHLGSGQQLSGAGMTGLAWVITVARAAAGATATALAGMLFWAVVPLATGWHADVILSGSMTPHIAPGDLVVVAPGTVGIRSGQVIEFTDPANPRRQLVHRVVARNADGTLTTR